VGASDRAGSFGLRLATEALRSPSVSKVHLVHPQRSQVLGQRCLPSLADVPAPVDVALLGVPDRVLVDQVGLAAERGDGGAVVFGSAHGLGGDIASAAKGMPLCGGGCMGFVNVARGVRAIGYLERDPLPAGGIALVSHSGSVFSALLRTSRRLEFSLAVSSGQELVTTAADYFGYALQMPETRVIGLFLETLRDPTHFRACLAEAAARDVPVVALTVGGSPAGRALVEAHSGALAGDDAAWEAMCATYGIHRALSLDEMVDTLEAFSVGRRVRSTGAGRGIATVHDSGAERVLVADVAQRLGVPFADIGEATKARLRPLLDPGLQPVNPLDVWGSGADTARVLTECLAALADDDEVAVVALAVDLVAEYDGDQAYPEAVEAVLARTDKPVVVLTNVAAAVDHAVAGRLRMQGVPVLEGTWSGLRTLRHLLARRPPLPATDVSVDRARSDRWRGVLASGSRLEASASMALLAEYGIPTVSTRSAGVVTEVLAAARDFRFPVAVKTDDPAIGHKAAAGGVVLDLWSTKAVRSAYEALAARLGPRVVVQPQLSGSAELYLGLVVDPMVGPIVIVGIGGSRVESLHSRRMALAPLSRELAVELVEGFVDDGEPLVAALLGVSQIAVELGECLSALDVNPLLIVEDGGAVAVDALVVPR
jgi:acyl-CoA synthetase (NDP forming)